MTTKTMIQFDATKKVIKGNRYTSIALIIQKDTYKDVYEFLIEKGHMNTVGAELTTEDDYKNAILNSEDFIKSSFKNVEVEVIDEDSQAWKMLQKIKELAKAGESKDWAIIDRVSGRLLNNEDTGNLQRIFAYNAGGEQFYGVYGDIALGQMDSRDYDDKAIYFAISRALRAGDLLEDVNVKEFLNTHDTSYLDRRI